MVGSALLHIAKPRPAPFLVLDIVAGCLLGRHLLAWCCLAGALSPYLFARSDAARARPLDVAAEMGSLAVNTGRGYVGLVPASGFGVSQWDLARERRRLLQGES